MIFMNLFEIYLDLSLIKKKKKNQIKNYADGAMCVHVIWRRMWVHVHAHASVCVHMCD